jgi:PAS domain S-box-containing protein
MAAIPQELIQAAIAGTQAGVVWVDANGIVVNVNTHAEAIFGRMHVGSHISECSEKYEVLRADGTPCPPLEIPLARAALRGEHVTDEVCKIRRPDGRMIDVLATAYPLRNEAGVQVGAILAMTDVTNRVLLERKLAQSEARFRALVQATGQMVWVTDASGAVREDSPSWRAFTWQSLVQWLGDGWLYAIHPEDRERAASAWQRAVDTRTPYEVEYRLRRHDGVYRRTVSRGAPTFDERGAVREWVGCTWDLEPSRQPREHAISAH